jgi:Ca2+ transporting ATPase
MLTLCSLIDEGLKFVERAFFVQSSTSRLPKAKKEQ